MGRMQLNAVIAGAARPERGQTEIMDDGVDIPRLEHLDGLAPARARHFHEVNDLRHHLRVRGAVHLVHQIAMAGQEVIVRQA